MPRHADQCGRHNAGPFAGRADYHRARDIGVGFARVFERARGYAAGFNLAKYKTSLQMIALGCLLAGPTGDALLPGLLTSVWPTVAVGPADGHYRLRLSARRPAAHAT